MSVTALPPEVLERLRRYDTPTLANAIETFDVRPRDEGFAGLEVRCMFPELGPMVGYAATATIRARGRTEGESDHRPLWDLVRSLPEPRVVVMQDLDDPPAHGAFWGEVQANVFRALGCVGTVTDGSVRDLNEVRELGFHLFARGPAVSHAYVRLESVGEPVTVAGLRVGTGDLLHADRHGVLLVPHQIAAELPAAADRIVEREQAFIRWLRSPDFDPDRLAEMRPPRPPPPRADGPPRAAERTLTVPMHTWSPAGRARWTDGRRARPPGHSGQAGTPESQVPRIRFLHQVPQSAWLPWRTTFGNVPRDA